MLPPPSLHSGSAQSFWHAPFSTLPSDMQEEKYVAFYQLGFSQYKFENFSIILRFFVKRGQLRIYAYGVYHLYLVLTYIRNLYINRR